MEEVLVYVKPVCKNTNGTFEYDFFFSDTPEYVWGPDWDVNVPSANGDITPDSTTYTKIRRVNYLTIKTDRGNILLFNGICNIWYFSTVVDRYRKFG